MSLNILKVIALAVFGGSAAVAITAPTGSMCCVCSRGSDSGGNLVSFSNASNKSCNACCAATGTEYGYGRSVSDFTCSTSGKIVSELMCLAPDPDPFCCTSCDAGGCSAFYSPMAVAHYACSKGEKIVELPNHGKTCKAPSAPLKSYLGSPSQLALLTSVEQASSATCACHGPTWTEIDEDGIKKKKGKARLVAIGYKDSEFATSQVEAPTQTRVARNVQLRVARGLDHDLSKGDLGGAFLQG